MSNEVLVPDIGEFDEVEIVEVLVQAGDEVEAETSLVTLESDKASMDIPAPAAGKIAAVHVAVGDMVGEGALIVTLQSSAEGAGAEVEATPAAKDVEAAATGPEPESVPSPPAQEPTIEEKPRPTAAAGSRRPRPAPDPPALDEAIPHASPSVRRFARELGVDLHKVRGSGPKGRILKDDVQSFVKEALHAPTAVAEGSAIPPIPTIDFSRFGEVEEVPLSRIRRLSKNNLHRSWLNVPHVTQHDLADVTELEAFRKSRKAEAEAQGVKLTPLAFIMKAVVAALQEFPRVCSSLSPSGEALIYKKYYHLGVAVDTDDGLMVPVVRDVDRKGLYELAADLAQVSDRARARKLTPSDIQGACFTISSLGSIGGTAFTPIVNAPEVAILGVSRSRLEPVWSDGGVVPRLMLPLSLSYDHRVVDGAEAVRFTTYLKSVLEDVRMLLL